MRRLPLLLIALPLCLVLAAPASALTPQSGTYKGSGKSKCVNPDTRKTEKCKATVRLTVSKGYITKVNIKLANGFSTDTPIAKERKVKISSKGKFSFKLTIVSNTTYSLKGKFSSSTKLSGTYKAIGGLSTEDFPKTTFSAKRK